MNTPKPGRELDAHISRVVFGQCPHPTSARQQNKCLECGESAIWGDDWHGEHGYCCAYYSSNVGAAWLIIHHLRDKGWQCEVGCDQQQSWARCQPASDSNTSRDNVEVTTAREQEALAVCLVALKIIEKVGV